MGYCVGCSKRFHFLENPLCSKCKKIDDTSSETEKSAVQKIPQCNGCGCVYPHLIQSLCGSCEELQGGHAPQSTQTDSLSLVGTLAQRTLALEQNATQVRLGTPLLLNNGLVKGHQINQKVNMLKKMQRSDIVKVRATLVLHAIKKNGKWTSQNSPLPAVNLPLSPSEPMNTVIDTLLACCESSYNDMLSKLKVKQQKPSFARSDVMFGVSAGKGKADSSFSIEISLLQNRSLGQVYGEEKRRQTICETDARDNLFHFRIHVHECPLEVSLEEPDYVSRVSSMITRSTSRMLSMKRKLSITENTGSNDSPYTSRYRPRAKKCELEYEAYSFMRKTVQLDNGEIVCDVSSNAEIIFVSKEWRKSSKEDNGFIGSGLNKNVFQAHIGTDYYALAEYKAVAAYSISNKDNSKNLFDQLVLLTWGDFFLEGFYNLAKSVDYNGLPKMTWNSKKAFLGTHATNIDTEGENINIADSDKLPALRYSDFLATPLITSNGNEVRFSGTDAPGVSKNHIGQCVDAFAHHTVVDSLGEVLLVDLQGFVFGNSVVFIDPQAHTFDSSSGHWDGGSKLIEDFLNQHKCNAVCKRLGLDIKQVTVPKAPKASSKMSGYGQ